jgi:hypothetical protein
MGKKRNSIFSLSDLNPLYKDRGLKKYLKVKPMMVKCLKRNFEGQTFKGQTFEGQTSNYL